MAPHHEAITVLYDDDCGFCRWSVDKIRAWDRRGTVSFASIQGPGGVNLLHEVPVTHRLDSMHAVTAAGRVHSGGDAVRVILHELPGGRAPAWLAATFPGVTDRAYRLIARRRQRLGRLLGQKACAVDPTRLDQ